MKKMNKMYEAPKAEMVQLNVDKNLMDTPGGEWNASGSDVDSEWDS